MFFKGNIGFCNVQIWYARLNSLNRENRITNISKQSTNFSYQAASIIKTTVRHITSWNYKYFFEHKLNSYVLL